MWDCELWTGSPLLTGALRVPVGVEHLFVNVVFTLVSEGAENADVLSSSPKAAASQWMHARRAA